MNKIFLIGRLTKDPELRYTPNGTAIASFTLAVNRRVANQNGEREADFVPIVVWNKAGENAAKYLAKGRQVAVEGRLQIRSYDGNDGNKRWVTEVIADNVEFLGSGSSSSNNQQNNNQHSGWDSMGEQITFNDNEIPF